MANTHDTNSRLKKKKNRRTADEPSEDILGSGMTARQYQRLSAADRLQLQTEVAGREDAAAIAATEQGVTGFFKKFSGIEKIAAVSLALLLVIGVTGSGLGTKLINSFSTGNNSDSAATGTGSHEPDLSFSSFNPFAAAPPPSATPQLSKEYVYAGSRMLAVVDAGATEVPPADLAIWRPSSGEWWVRGGTGSQQVTQQWGTSGDIPAPGDYDGDGKTDFAVFRPGNNTWYMVHSAGGGGQFPFGSSGDIVAPADYDGDGMTDVAVYRPSDGTWYIRRSSDSSVIFQQFGLSTDIPAPADYDGDGRADIAVWRNSDTNFYTLQSSDNAIISTNFNSSSTKPVSADYDGDGQADYAIRNSNNWIILNSATNQIQTTPWQQAGDVAVQNDYDGDGKVDIAVWSDASGYWNIRNSSNLTHRAEQWGLSGDIPVPAFYRR